MKVLYDVSVFGPIQCWPKYSNGVFRVVDNLARALIESEKCSLCFSAVESEWHYYALKYVEESSGFNEINFPHSKWQYRLFCEFYKAKKHAEITDGFQKIWWTMVRKLWHRSVQAFSTKVIQEESLKWANIFHSPYFAIPNQVREQKNVNTFITVYDLIAIFFPKYSEIDPQRQQHPLKKIIESIQTDDWIACISQSTKNDLCNYRKDIDPQRIFVTHLGASACFYPCRDLIKIESVLSKYKIPKGQYILSVCTFEPRKNLSHLIRCFLQLIQQESLKDLHLVLVGSLGWKYESIFNELTGMDDSVRKRIVITGRVADEDMAALYSGAIAFVYPSLYEGFGLPPLEAMQCGTPVITSNNSSLPEVVGNAGIMVDPTDAEGLCQAMLQLSTKADLRQTMSQKSLEQAKLFSWAQCANQTIAAYEAAMNS